MRDAKNTFENGYLTLMVLGYFVLQWLTSWIWVLSSFLFMNHRNTLISGLMQVINLCIVLIAIKSSLLIDLLKSIGSSEPTYVSRNDDWFKAVPNLVMWNVSITSICICLANETGFHMMHFSPCPVILWLSTGNWFYCPILCAQSWPSMDSQYHQALRQILLVRIWVTRWVSRLLKKEVKCWKVVKMSGKTREKKKVRTLINTRRGGIKERLWGVKWSQPS